MSDRDEAILGKEPAEIAIDNIIFEGLDDIIGVVKEAEKAARQDDNIVRLGDLQRMRAILLEAKRAIENVQKEAGKRGNP